jgi:ribonuclease P protein component
LSGRAAFERLLKTGERRNFAGYTFFFARRESGPPRLGVLISRRHARKATDRNRIKRCIREAFRTGQAQIGPLDVLVRPPLSVNPGPAMIIRVRELLARLAAQPAGR